MRSPFSTLLSLASITTICHVTWLMPATAQIIPDQTLEFEQSNVIPNVNIRGINSDLIDGGAIRNSNLFHSFQEFNIEAGRGAYFVNPVGIENILSRVTGNNISNILGTLGVLGNANLFLINPNGIVFGPNARLDVGGSFFASTANSIGFGMGLEFAATDDPQAPPLLTINIPMGLNFRQNPGQIVVQGLGHNLRFDPETGATIRDQRPVGLQVPSGQTLALVGGDVILEGGNLTAEAGRIELGSIAGVGQARLPATKGEGLSYEGVSSFGNIQLSQAASVDVSGGGAGNIQVQGRRIQLHESGAMLADTLGSQSGGSLTVRASELLELTGTTPEDPLPNGLLAQVSPEAKGQGGNLTVDTQRLTLSSGAQISAGTFGIGNGGDLTVKATQVELMGFVIIPDEIPGPSGLFAQVEREATGQGGNLRIETERLRLSDRAQISAGTLGSGNGGDLTVKATEVELIGHFTNLVNRGNIGKGGNLTIETEGLTVSDGAQVSTSTLGIGDAGKLTVTAKTVELIGTSAEGARSGLFAASGTRGFTEVTGQGGSLRIETERLRLSSGAVVATTAFGKGDAGNLTVTAKTVELIGTAAEGTLSGLFARTLEKSRGNGGTLRVMADELTVRDGARITVSSQGKGEAGNLEISVPSIRLDNQASLRAETRFGEQGNITLNAEEIQLRRESQITTDSSETGTGGNIEINTDLLTAIENSDISANAQEGPGGQVRINALGIFGTQFREQQTSASDITATSELGPSSSGTVELNTQFDPSSALIELPAAVVDPAALIAQEFCRQRRGSEFVNTRRGGLPPGPQESLRSEETSVGLIELDPNVESRRSHAPSQTNSTRRTSSTKSNQPISSLDLVPARGWIRDQNGDVILVSYDPTKTGVQRQGHRLIQCQP